MLSDWFGTGEAVAWSLVPFSPVEKVQRCLLLGGYRGRYAGEKGKCFEVRVMRTRVPEGAMMRFAVLCVIGVVSVSCCIDQCVTEHLTDIRHPWHAIPSYAGMVVSMPVGFAVFIVSPDEAGYGRSLAIASWGTALLGGPFYVVFYPLELVWPLERVDLGKEPEDSESEP